MAQDNITASLFGLDPALLAQQRQEQDMARGMQLAQLDPMQAAAAPAFATANRFGRDVGSLLGVQDPQMQQQAKVQAVKQQAKQMGIDPNTAQGMAAFGKLLAEAGLEEKAMIAADKAQKMAEQEATTGLAQNKLAQEGAFRKAMRDLGPNPTQEQLSAVAAQFGSPDKVMDVQTKSLDRQAQMEAKKAELEAKLAQQLEIAKDNNASREQIARMQVEGRQQIAGMMAALKQESMASRAAERSTKAANLSPTAQKELFATDNIITSSDDVVKALEQAKEINDKAWGFKGSSTIAQATNLIPGNYEGANATIDLDNLVTGQALASLKATFGAMPTEGERKILLEIQGSTALTPKQREKVWDRAIDLAKKHKQQAEAKAESMRSGSFFKESPIQAAPKQAAPTGYTPQQAAAELARRKGGQ